MRLKMISLAAIAMICFLGIGGIAKAADPSDDPIAANFFTPDLLEKTHDMIGLSDAQTQELAAAVSDAKEKMEALRDQLQHDHAELAEAVKGEKVDADKTLALMDDVMKLESEAKRIQLRILIKIKNALTSEQQAKLREIRDKFGGIQRKMREAMALGAKFKEQGGDVNEFASARDEFQQLMKDGKTADAEALLDKTIAALKEKLSAGK